MFEAAVRRYDVHELEVEWDAEAVERLREELAESRLLLLGEHHGREATPRALYTLIRAFGIRALALEWEPLLAPVVDDFLSTGRVRVPAELQPSFASGDGTLTAGHFALLARLHADGILDQLILFDDTPTDFGGPWHERDERMAQYLLRERRPELTTLVVAGAFHTLVDEQEAHATLGVRLRAAIGDVPTGRISYEPGARLTFARGRDGVYVLEVGDDTLGFVPALG